ncbi:hypothetical protein JCM11641_005831 [Rhodosporidiobolus odoratus]
MPPAASSSSSRSRNAAAPYPTRGESEGAHSPSEDGGEGQKGKKGGAKAAPDGRRHLSCENCRIRKMKCSRQSPCLSCRMRGDECVWIGTAPNGSADEDELESSANEVARLKRLVDLLLARLEEQDDQNGTAAATSAAGAAAVADFSPPATSTSAGHFPTSSNHRDSFSGAGSPLSEPRGPPSSAALAASEAALHPSMGAAPAAPQAHQLPPHYLASHPAYGGYPYGAPYGGPMEYAAIPFGAAPMGGPPSAMYAMGGPPGYGPRPGMYAAMQGAPRELWGP